MLLFSPKAGCTSLTKWFFYHIGKLDEALKYNTWVHRYRTEVFTVRPDYDARSLRLLKGLELPVVKLVRNPYDRAVSSFMHVIKLAHNKRQPSWQIPLVEGARHQAGKSMPTPVRLSFRDFMQHIGKIGAADPSLNVHVAQQYRAGERDLNVRIIRVEQFEADIRRLEAEYGLPASPLELIVESRHHVSNHTRAPKSEPAFARRQHPADWDIGYRRIRNHNLPAYADMYDDALAELVHSSFADDFENYGYDRTVPRREAP